MRARDVHPDDSGGPSGVDGSAAYARHMQLSGAWLAAEADDDVRRNGIGLDTDDSGWSRISVPGHWQDHAEFRASDGPIMYRHAFSAEPPADGRRRWITLDGIFYQADVWLDGAYLGDPEGYFISHSFDVTSLSRFGDDHVLAVEVTCAPQHGTTGRRNITGVFQTPAGIGSSRNPGGLWRPVVLYETGPVHIGRLRVLCRDADARRAHLRIATRLDSDRFTPVTMRTLVDGVPIDEQHQTIAAGQNDFEWTIDIIDPDLWWPRAIGDQPLVEVEVEVVVDGEVSDRRQRRTGLRQIVWDDWVCSVNGERIFLKGANILPTSAAPANATSEMIRADLQAAVDLGLDALRVHGHIADRALYNAADESGILLLQDFPLQWGHARAVRQQAVEQARAAVDSLGHHPSIAMWTAHDDPSATDAAVTNSGWRGKARTAAATQLPSWNKSVLDRWVKRAFERADSSRQVVAHSGVVPHLPQLDGTDSHLWFGWRRGEAEDLADFAARLPRMVRFVSEFGSDSPPTDAGFIEEQLSSYEWPSLDWDQVQAETGYQRAVTERSFPPTEFDGYDEWRDTLQYYQAHVLKVQIETLRRLKYRPTGGFCFSSLNDSAPSISSSILDHQRRPKAAYAAVAAACAAVLVVADPMPDELHPGDRFDADVHVVSDLRTPLDFAVVDVVASWRGGSQRWRFGGPVAADDVVLVGRIHLDIAEATGPIMLDLRLTAGDVTSHNHYATTITDD
jgi:beta-mannosidase